MRQTIPPCATATVVRPHGRLAVRTDPEDHGSNILIYFRGSDEGSWILSAPRQGVGLAFGGEARRRLAGRWARLAVHTDEPSGCLCLGSLRRASSPKDNPAPGKERLDYLRRSVP